MTADLKFPRGRKSWLLAGSLMVAQIAAAAVEDWPGRAEIEFQATSTLHDFSGTVRTEPFHALVDLDGAVATLGGTAVVAVAQMDTRHLKRDENMRAMFEAVRFPLITGILEPTRIDPATPAPVPLRLQIRDRTQTVPVTLADWQVKADRIQFDLTMVLSLEKFGLKPPVLLGFIKVGDSVAVRIRGALEKPPAPAATP